MKSYTLIHTKTREILVGLPSEKLLDDCKYIWGDAYRLHINLKEFKKIFKIIKKYIFSDIFRTANLRNHSIHRAIACAISRNFVERSKMNTSHVTDMHLRERQDLRLHLKVDGQTNVISSGDAYGELLFNSVLNSHLIGKSNGDEIVALPFGNRST